MVQLSHFHARAAALRRRMGGMATVILALVSLLVAPGCVGGPWGVAPRNTVVIKMGEHMAVEYERAFHPNVSAYIGPSLFAGFASTDAAVHSEIGFGGSLGARFFVLGMAPEGLFIGPSLNMNYSRLNSAGQVSSGLRVTTGAMVGYTFIFLDVFALSFGVGGNYVNVSTVYDASTAPAPLEAAYRFALGVAF